MTNFFRADLHCHSTCSDGSLTPEELIAQACRQGLQGLAITDHDTTGAYSTAIAAAQAAGIELINGAEFSTVYENQSIHLLAYSFSLQAPSIQSLCQRHVRRRMDRNLAILSLLQGQGIALTAEDISAEGAKNSILGRPHIALALKRRGYVSDVREAFSRYLGDDASCYVQGEPISTAETIEQIHAANAYVVLAHPHLIKSGALVNALMKLPFDGLEVYYGTFNAQQSARWLQLAEKYQLFLTGGSDFHGDIRPHIPLGCSWTPEETFRLLQGRYKTNNPSL